ncbi:SMP-30/gluconolactonase/LRE family protein [Microbacterium sp. NEAU-LLC]|uniref:SMP-30/gluconolactonase/LRE family protein n=1 Tax=Microbacterium helvum TaxID=2773713 RepID=A0ABR8NWE0_9MICO|nr:SMP-30/gluconolactonase/LRE family protein [Microbacterium helvum]
MEPGYADVPLLATAEPATDEPQFLGEGPTWDPIRERLLWVDIMAGAVHVGRLHDDGRVEPQSRIQTPDSAGAVAVAADGALVVAGTSRLHYVSGDGAISSGRELVTGEGRRFNDGKPDPAGRFVVGTLGPGDELLLRVEAGVDEPTTVIDDDLTLSNGLAWSADGRRFYSADTGSSRIFVRSYDPATGATGPRTVFAALSHGHPDGMTIDADDHVWVAVWGGGCVLRFAPDGRLVGRVDVPAPHTTCPVFAGPELDTLVVTTATEHLTQAQRDAHPLSGRVFTARPGVRGIPPLLWGGR